jgi:hypothetical protein
MPASFFVSERFLFLGTGIHLIKPIHANPLLRSGVEYRQKLRSLCLSPVGYHCNLSLITVIDSTEGGNGERGICPTKSEICDFVDFVRMPVP